MPSAPLNDDAIWGLPGAKVAEPRKGAETFSEMPLWELLCRGAAHDPDAVALVGRSGALRYGELLRIAQNTAAALAERIAPGEAGGGALFPAGGAPPPPPPPPPLPAGGPAVPPPNT